MKRILIFSFIVVAILTSGACKKAKNSTVDYFIFSTSGGNQSANHATIFCISQSTLTSDTLHPLGYMLINANGLNFSVALPDSEFAKVKDLPKSIPDDLLRDGSETYGVPLIDGSSTTVLASIGGQQHIWVFNDNLSKCSAAVQQFYKKITF